MPYAVRQHSTERVKSKFHGRQMHLMFCCCWQYDNDTRVMETHSSYPQWGIYHGLTLKKHASYENRAVSRGKVKICRFVYQQQFFLPCENCVLGRIRIDDIFRCWADDSSWFWASRAFNTWEASVRNSCIHQCLKNVSVSFQKQLPSVLWRCLLGVKKSIRSVKIWVMWCWHGYLQKWSANSLHMVQLMPVPPHHLCFSKIQNALSFWYRLT